MKKNKYQANPCYFSPSLGIVTNQKISLDAIYFASRFELRVYQRLCDSFGIKNVKTQVPLLIKPESKNYPRLVWHCDFRVMKPTSDDEYVNVEAKGFLTPEFKRNLQYLEFFSPYDFDRLMLVGDCPSYWIDSKVTTWELENAISYLDSQGYS